MSKDNLYMKYSIIVSMDKILKLIKKGYILTGFFMSIIFFSCDSHPKRSLIVGKLQSMSKLATTEIVVSKLVVGRKDLNILFLRELNTATFVVDTEASIKLGIDLSKLHKGDIEIEENSISLSLPQVEVISFSYPAENFNLIEEWTDKSKFLNNIRPEDQEAIYREAELSICKNLVHLNAIKTCEKLTAIMMKKLLTELGFEEVYITHKPTVKLFPQFKFSESNE